MVGRNGKHFEQTRLNIDRLFNRFLLYRLGPKRVAIPSNGARNSGCRSGPIRYTAMAVRSLFRLWSTYKSFGMDVRKEFDLARFWIRVLCATNLYLQDYVGIAPLGLP